MRKYNKLCSNEVKQIRKFIKTKFFTQQEIAKWYNTVQSNIGFIKRNVTWNYYPPRRGWN